MPTESTSQISRERVFYNRIGDTFILAGLYGDNQANFKPTKATEERPLSNVAYASCFTGHLHQFYSDVEWFDRVQIPVSQVDNTKPLFVNGVEGYSWKVVNFADDSITIQRICLDNREATTQKLWRGSCLYGLRRDYSKANQSLTQIHEDEDKFIKHDEGKPPLALLLRVKRVLEEVVRVYEHGDKTYRVDNWRKCKKPDRFLHAAFRHMFAGVMTKDKQSKLLHGAHAIASLAYYMELMLGIESETSKTDSPT